MSEAKEITWYRGRLHDAVHAAFRAGEWPAPLGKDDMLSVVILLRGGEPDCVECRETGISMGPSHRGALRCESGSLASGGETAHCSCGVCF